MYWQSTSLLSFPTQATLSRRIGPDPWPKCALEYAVAPVIKKKLLTYKQSYPTGAHPAEKLGFAQCTPNYVNYMDYSCHISLYPDPPPKRKGESGEYSTALHHGLAVAIDSVKG